MTWGISDSLFLAAYAVVAGTGLLGALLWRWYTTSGGDRERQPSVVELAYLVDGPLGACYASIAGLRRAHTVVVAELSTVVARGDPPVDASKLTRSLHRALRFPRTWPAVVLDSSVTEALGDLKHRLIRRGWLMSAKRARRTKLAAVPLFTIGTVGIARLVVISESASVHRPGPVVGLAVVVAATLLVAGRLVRPAVISTVARRELRWARRRRLYLSPHGNHNWSDASARDLMFAVALFGPAVLRSCDPVFARAIGIDPWDATRDPLDAELAVAERISRVQRRRRHIRLWAASRHSPSGINDLGRILGGQRPNLFWRVMWRLRRARR